ncbi:hypothetical protein EDC04DRAFT_2515208, partial [Pisolithus marmoratus]
SADAHLILFRQIFEFAQYDTGLSVKFHHIHGCGIEAVIADGHKGQGLDMEGFCSTEHQCRLQELDPYDHLRHFYCLCTVHFLQN